MRKLKIVSLANMNLFNNGGKIMNNVAKYPFQLEFKIQKLKEAINIQIFHKTKFWN